MASTVLRQTASHSATYESNVVTRPKPPLPTGVVPGSRLEARPANVLARTGVPTIDAMAGGLPRGALSEIYGPASSGRTSLILSALAEATARQEVCALVDASDSFDPESAAAAGVALARVLWVRCGQMTALRPRVTNRSTNPPGGNSNSPAQQFRPLEHVLKTTDLLLQSGGFGMVLVDLGDVPPQMARRIPLTSWFRFRRAVENTPTVLVVVEQEPYAKTCASLVLKMEGRKFEAERKMSGAQSDIGEVFGTRPNHSSARRGPVAVRRAAPPGYPNPQCYPDFERVPRQAGAADGCQIVEFGRNAGATCSQAPTLDRFEIQRIPATGPSLPAHTRILRLLPMRAELVHARGQKKPAQTVTALASRTAWAG